MEKFANFHELEEIAAEVDLWWILCSETEENFEISEIKEVILHAEIFYPNVKIH